MGCRRVAPQDELLRVAAGPDGPVVGRGAPGRGAWLCPRPSCLDAAFRRGGLARALRCAVPPTFRESIAASAENLADWYAAEREPGSAGLPPPPG